MWSENQVYYVNHVFMFPFNYSDNKHLLQMHVFLLYILRQKKVYMSSLIIYVLCIYFE